MSGPKVILVTVFALLVCTFAMAQTTADPPIVAPPGNRVSAAPNLRVISPKNGQAFAVDFVNVQYQITNPAAAANNLPTFLLSLDGGDPVQTADTSHTFTGLAPGEHTLIVELVDANGLPVSGTQNEVHFVIATGTNAAPRGPGASTQVRPTPQVRTVSTSTENNTASKVSERSTTPDENNLPSSGSALPLLSVIGFGVLVGGIASALKTR